MHDEKLRLLATCGYPSDARPSYQPFVRELLRALAGLGAEVTVIAPETRSRGRAGGSRAPEAEIADGVAVYRPRFTSFSEVRLPLLGSTAQWSDASYRRAALRIGLALGAPSVCYGHFLYPHGAAALALAARLGVPAVVSLGESSFRRYERAYSTAETAALLARFAAIIVNSPVLEGLAVERYGVPRARVTLLPNGVDARFHPHDRAACRRELGLPPERPIVVCVGHWIPRKGPLRVMEAIRARPDVGAVFLGQGPERPSGPQVLHAGPVPPGDVPRWLSAADLFVLPTLDEGCSNAVLEALACGLPVVTSDRPFNRALLDDTTACLVEPTDVAALAAAITRLVDAPAERARLSAAALAHARGFTLARRAERVLALLREVASGRR